MAILTVGRLGFDVELDHPASWEETRNDTDRELTVQGYIKSTLATAKYLRTELLEQQNQLVAVTYTGDDYFDGYFWLASARVSTILGSYRAGLFPFELTFMRLGSSSRVELQSLLTYTTLTNDFGIIGSGDLNEASEAWHAVPASHFLYEGNANLGSVLRASEDGNIRVYRQVQIGSVAATDDATPDPTWGIAPSDFYDGAARIKVDGKLRTGLDVSNLPNNWELSNGIIKVSRISATASRIDVAQWDGGAYATAKTYKLMEFNDATPSGVEITTWQTFTILRNDPECCIVRLIADNAIVGGALRQYLDLTLRRGSAAVYCHWTHRTGDPTTDLKIVRATAEAATTVTPPGASGPTGIRATSNDADGNRYVLGTRHTHTADTTEGGLRRENITEATGSFFHFFIGSEINGSSATTGNDAVSLMEQYFGWISEKVRAVLR